MIQDERYRFAWPWFQKKAHFVGGSNNAISMQMQMLFFGRISDFILVGLHVLNIFPPFIVHHSAYIYI